MLLLSQIAKDSQEIRQQIVKYNPELPVLSVRSLEEACIFIEDLLTSGATQEAKTTICILGNTGAGKSSLVRTLRDYCKSKNQEPKPFLTGDPQNKQFLETKVMELIQDIKLETSMKCVVELQKNLKDSRFGLISLCPEDSIREEGKEAISDHLQIAFVDFAGHSEYVSCSTLFMTETGIFLICFDIQKFLEVSAEDRYFPSIGTYLELVTDCCPAPIFLLVATKMDLCQSPELESKLSEIMDAAKQHLQSVSKRSSRLKNVFLFDEVIRTSSAQITKASLEGLSCKFVAICLHKELLDIKLETIPRVWRRMIEKAKSHLKVSINDLVQEYRTMDMQSDNAKLTEDVIALKGWEAVVKKIRERPRPEILEDQRSQKAQSLGSEKGLTMEDATNNPKETIMGRTKHDKKIKSSRDAKTRNLVPPPKHEEIEPPEELAAQRKKMKTILSILSANNEIFWFRLAKILLRAPSVPIIIN